MHEAPPLYIGSIVQVISPGYLHYGAQGQVVGFDDGDKVAPVRVWFGKEADGLIHYPERLEIESIDRYCIEPPPPSEQATDLRTRNYSRKDLTICSAWSMKTLADRYFKDFYHTLYEPKALFVSGARDCDVEGCPGVAIKRIIFNIWGSVYPADVCSSCVPKYDLVAGESFPWKKREVTVVD